MPDTPGDDHIAAHLAAPAAATIDDGLAVPQSDPDPPPAGPPRMRLRDWLREGLRAGLFLKPRVTAPEPSPLHLLLITAAIAALHLAIQRLEVDGPASFNLRGWLTPWWTTAVTTLLVWCLFASTRLVRPARRPGVAAWFALLFLASLPLAVVGRRPGHGLDARLASCRVQRIGRARLGPLRGAVGVGGGAGRAHRGRARPARTGAGAAGHRPDGAERAHVLAVPRSRLVSRRRRGRRQAAPGAEPGGLRIAAGLARRVAAGTAATAPGRGRRLRHRVRAVRARGRVPARKHHGPGRAARPLRRRGPPRAAREQRQHHGHAALGHAGQPAAHDRRDGGEDGSRRGPAGRLSHFARRQQLHAVGTPLAAGGSRAHAGRPAQGARRRRHPQPGDRRVGLLLGRLDRPAGR